MPVKKKQRNSKSIEGTVYYLNAPIAPPPPPPPPPPLPLPEVNPIHNYQYNTNNINIKNTNQQYNQLQYAPPYQNYYYPGYPAQPLQVQPNMNRSDFGDVDIGNDKVQMMLKASQFLGQVDDDSKLGAYYLNNIREEMEDNSKTSKSISYYDQVYKVVIHRDIPDHYFDIKSRKSSIRDDDDDKNDNNKIIEETKIRSEYEAIENFKKRKTDINYLNGDLIYSNGNNREKRRAELFENYSELFKFKEANRKELYNSKLSELDSKIRQLSIPILQPETSNYKRLDQQFYDLETDLIEERDFNIMKDKNWRNFKRLENTKWYYMESLKVYEEAYKELDTKLEKLKLLFQRQEIALESLDRDFTEISSPRAEKFFNGFPLKNNANLTNGLSKLKNQITTITREFSEQQHNSDSFSPETSDANSSSNQTRIAKRQRQKRASSSSSSPPSSNSSNNTIMYSILEGFAPLLTHDEFQIATGEELSSRYNFSSPLHNIDASTPQDSETDTTTYATSTPGMSISASKKQKRSVGRPSRESRGTASGTERNETVSSIREHNNINTLNKIMKHYVSPDSLNNQDIESDLALFHSLKKPMI